MKIVINDLNTDRNDIDCITQPLRTFIYSYLPKASHKEELPNGESMTVIFERFEDHVEVTVYYELPTGHTGEVE